MKKTHLLAAAAGAALLSAPASAQPGAVGDHVGEVLIFAGSFCPAGYTALNGQTLAIASESALFSLIGNAYGGNGQTDFNVPELRNRVAVGDGMGPGLTTRILGQSWGVEDQTLTHANMPAHTHGLYASTSPPDSSGPAGNAIATPVSGPQPYTDAARTNAFVSGTVSSDGAGASFENRAPVLGLMHCIAMSGGIYPSRN